MTSVIDNSTLLSDLERVAARAFFDLPKVKKMIARGGQYALVFGPSTGIGVPVTITVKGVDGTIISKDITDVGSW